MKRVSEIETTYYTLVTIESVESFLRILNNDLYILLNSSSSFNLFITPNTNIFYTEKM